MYKSTQSIMGHLLWDDSLYGDMEQKIDSQVEPAKYWWITDNDNL